MKKLVIVMVLVCSFLFGSELSDIEWDKKVFISKKNLGFTLCLKTFYKNLPNEIANADRLFGLIELSDPDDKKRFLNFIYSKIDSYIPKFKQPELYYEHWYFVACLNMYNSKEYEDMIQRKGKYAK